MEKDRRDLFILGGISFILIVLLVFSAVKFKIDMNEENNYKINSNIQNSGVRQEDSNKDIVPTPTPSSNTDEKEPTKTVEPTKSPEPTEPPSPTPSLDTTSDEGEVVRYFTNLETSAFSGDSSSLKDKCKNAFTTVVDFLFYDKEIKGYTFSDLTTEAKLKIIKIALSIDNKIDEYFPDYKNTLKEAMTNLKGKAALLYLETTSKLCDSVGESACREARQDFKNMKESFGFTWNLIKSGASKGYSYLKEILGEWYRSI